MLRTMVRIGQCQNCRGFVLVNETRKKICSICNHQNIVSRMLVSENDYSTEDARTIIRYLKIPAEMRSHTPYRADQRDMEVKFIRFIPPSEKEDRK